MLQQPTEIGGPVAHEIEIGLRRVHVAACRIPMKQAKRDQGVEEIPGAAWMYAGSPGKNGEFQGACRKRREDVEFHGCEQYLGAPERIRKIEYAFRRGFLALHYHRPIEARCCWHGQRPTICRAVPQESERTPQEYCRERPSQRLSTAARSPSPSRWF